MKTLTLEQLMDFLIERLAIHEGGAGAIQISWDDATRDYIISQQKLRDDGSEILGCGSSLAQAISSAISGKRFND